jgi:hypothetical protein
VIVKRKPQTNQISYLVLKRFEAQISVEISDLLYDKTHDMIWNELKTIFQWLWDGYE